MQVMWRAELLSDSGTSVFFTQSIESTSNTPSIDANASSPPGGGDPRGRDFQADLITPWHDRSAKMPPLCTLLGRKGTVHTGMEKRVTCQTREKLGLSAQVSYASLPCSCRTRSA